MDYAAVISYGLTTKPRMCSLRLPGNEKDDRPDHKEENEPVYGIHVG